MQKTVKITWQQYAKDIAELAYSISEYQKERKIKFNKIYPIIRGGLIPGVNLSHLLDINELNFNLFKLLANSKVSNDKVLIVEDVSDTGNTLLKLTNLLNKTKLYYRVATLYVKDMTKYYPHFWVRQYPKDIWIQYPWEKRRRKK